MFCRDCDNSLCLNCNRDIHFEKKDRNDHTFQMICQECEEHFREMYCPDCEEYLCLKCDSKIHNKGKRVLHQRFPIEQKEKYKILFNVVYYENEELLLNSHSKVLGGLGTQAPYTIFCSQEKIEKPIENLFHVKEGLIEFIVGEFGLDVFLNYLVIIGNEPQNNIKQDLLEIYPFSQLYINEYPFWKGGLRKKPSSENILHKSALSDEKSNLIEKGPKLSFFFNKNEELQMSSDVFLVSKLIEGKQMKSLAELGGRISPCAIYHVYNDLFTDSLIPSTLSYLIQNMLKSLCQSGIIQVDYNQFLKEIRESLRIDEGYAQNVLLRSADLNIIVINNRQVTQHHQLNFVSLKIEVLSLENLKWVVKNLKIDRVTPIETVVLSRLKQSFGMKIKPRIWKAFIHEFKIYLDCFTKGNAIINLDPMFNSLKITLEANPFDKSSMTYIFDITDIDLPAEDIECVPRDSDLWKSFKTYINELYEQDLMFFNAISKEPLPITHKKKKQDLDAPIYKKESMSSHHQSNNLTDKTDTYSKSKESIVTGSHMSNTEVSEGKVIPGGRYGLTQFIKYYGPDVFKNLSYGKLSRLVQTIIDDNTLTYNATYLVKADPNSSLLSTEKVMNKDKEIKKKLAKIKEKLIEVLIENNNYIPLAQLKKFLVKKLEFKVNLEELGFSKLRQLLSHFDDSIKVESLGDNHFYLELNKDLYEKNKHLHKTDPEKVKSFLPILDDLSSDSLQYKFNSSFDRHSLNNYNAKSSNKPKLGNMSWNGPSQQTGNSSNIQSFDFKSKRRTMTTTEGFLLNVLNSINEIVKDHPYGIDVVALHEQLTVRLNIGLFNSKTFGCDNFHTFLLNYADQYVDIELAKNQSTGGVSFIIYPKSFRFGFQSSTTSGLNSKKKLSTSLKLSSEPFTLKTLGQSPLAPYQQKSSKTVANWASLINTSFLDDLPNPTSNLSAINDEEGGHSTQRPQASLLNNSTMELKEYLDYISILLPEKNENSLNTFYSANGFDNSVERSFLTIPSELSSLINKNSIKDGSRGYSCEIRKLNKVGEGLQEDELEFRFKDQQEMSKKLEET